MLQHTMDQSNTKEPKCWTFGRINPPLSDHFFRAKMNKSDHFFMYVNSALMMEKNINLLHLLFLNGTNQNAYIDHIQYTPPTVKDKRFLLIFDPTLLPWTMGYQRFLTKQKKKCQFSPTLFYSQKSAYWSGEHKKYRWFHMILENAAYCLIPPNFPLY